MTVLPAFFLRGIESTIYPENSPGISEAPYGLC